MRIMPENRITATQPHTVSRCRSITRISSRYFSLDTRKFSSIRFWGTELLLFQKLQRGGHGLISVRLPPQAFLSALEIADLLYISDQTLAVRGQNRHILQILFQPSALLPVSFPAPILRAARSKGMLQALTSFHKCVRRKNSAPSCVSAAFAPTTGSGPAGRRTAESRTT